MSLTQYWADADDPIVDDWYSELIEEQEAEEYALIFGCDVG